MAQGERFSLTRWLGQWASNAILEEMFSRGSYQRNACPICADSAADPACAVGYEYEGPGEDRARRRLDIDHGTKTCRRTK
mmetsp:Transcript_72940/g.170907  ORF Transcript_72940/g.170907 Transcript_72940/m.170907 type:complete len:80 (+) Transcript_72940:85-324(+)